MSKKKGRKGGKRCGGFIGVETLLVIVLVGVIAFFVPNKVSESLGIGNRQNKTVQSDTVTLISDKDGVPIAYRRVTSDKDMQQHITLWQQLMTLPSLWLFLMLLSPFSTAAAGIFAFINKKLKEGFKQVVIGVEVAKKKMTPEATAILDTSLSRKMDLSQKTAVKKIKADPKLVIE